MHRFLGTTLAVAATAAAVAAPAAATTPTRTFDVSVEGVQKTTFSVSHSPWSHCDQSQSGSGYERVDFASTRPQRMVAHRYARNVVVFDDGRPGHDEVRVAARITRSNHVVSGPLDPRCEGTGGSTTPTPARDCGTRHDSFGMFLGWWPSGPVRGITLRRGIHMPGRSRFRNCLIDGFAFPQFLESTSTGRQIVASIPAADLFDPGLRKHIVIGRGHFTAESAAGSNYATSIRWTVSLTAINH